jgi:lipid-binding SYLF domain-containing protein
MKKIMLSIMVAALAGNAFALDRYELDQRIRALEGKFEAFQSIPGKGIAASTLKEARGIVLLDRTKAGFVFAYQGGSGIALVRDRSTGAWGPAAFVKANEASLGVQAGGEQNFYVILLMDDQSVRRLTEANFKFGGEARGTAGDAHGGVAGDINGRREYVLVYVDRQGLFGGAALKGGSIAPDADANRIYYDHFATMQDILFGDKKQPTDAARDLAATLDKYSINKYSAANSRPRS